MNKNAFLKVLQVNNQVKVIVNCFGQEMSFEGICTGITDDKLSILTSAKPEPFELPLSEIMEVIITEKHPKSGFNDLIDKLIQDFMNLVAIPIDPLDSKNLIAAYNINKIVVYNEFSLQHELGIYLRNKFANYNITFERNIKDFNIDDNDLQNPMVKHEIDIVIEDKNSDSKFAIELKFPRRREYPEQMYNFIKDIRFMEQVQERDKSHNFKNTYCITLVDDQNFYFAKPGMRPDGIYKYFRTNNSDERIITGEIHKPTGTKKEKQENYVIIDGRYYIEWNHLNEDKQQLAEKNHANYKAARYYLCKISLQKTNEKD